MTRIEAIQLLSDFINETGMDKERREDLRQALTILENGSG